MTIFNLYPRRGPLTGVCLWFHEHGDCWTPCRVRRAVYYSGHAVHRTWWRFTLVTERFPR